MSTQDFFEPVIDMVLLLWCTKTLRCNVDQSLTLVYALSLLSVTWKVVCTYSAFLVKKPVCCVSLSSADHRLSSSCKDCACGCRNASMACTGWVDSYFVILFWIYSSSLFKANWRWISSDQPFDSLFSFECNNLEWMDNSHRCYIDSIPFDEKHT